MTGLIFSAILFCFVLIGWAFFLSRLLKTNISLGLLNATAFCGLAIFFGFLGSIPQIITYVLAISGSLFTLGFTIKKLYKTGTIMPSKDISFPILLFLILGIICLLMSFDMTFRSIDDYSYWGVMSKYLYVFNSLPHDANYINASYLSYTPVMACIHYLAFTLARQYSQFSGYFAQGMIFVSAMMVFADYKHISRSLVNISLMFILFSLAYGNVLARMEVDAYVAAWFFAITWIVYKKKQDALVLIFIPLLFLSVIKEIGLLLSICVLVLYMVLEKPSGMQRARWIALLLALFAVKFIWKHHTSSYGFHSFSQSVSLPLALAALNPLNTNYQFVQYLYLKEILFSNFDHLLKTPWLVMYGMIAVIWYYLVKHYPTDKNRVTMIMGLFAIYSFIYLLMLYVLQAIVFGIKSSGSNVSILDFQRYYNMFFLPWVGLTIFVALDISKSQYRPLSRMVTSMTIIVAMIFLAGGKIERMRKFYRVPGLETIHDLVNQKIPALHNKNWAICLSNPPQPYYYLTMPLTWFYMPNRVFDPDTIAKTSNAPCDITVTWQGDNLRVT